MDERTSTIGSFSRSNGTKLFRINIDSAIESPDYIPNKVEFTKLGTMRVDQLEDGTYLTTNLHSHDRILTFDERGEFLSSYFEYPFQAELKEVRQEVLGLVYQSHLVLNKQASVLGVFNM